MAYAQTTVSSSATLVIGGIYDLQYPANQYNAIGISIERSQYNNGPWTTVASQLFFPPTTSNKYLTISATNQTIQYYYKTTVGIDYQGTYYEFIASIVQMPKQLQSAPSSPTLSSRTQNSITLNSISNGEYKRGTLAAQSSTLFSSLSAGTSYSFQQRYAETSKLQASNWSTAASFSTLTIVTIPTVYSFSADNITETSMRMRGYLNNDGGGLCDVYIERGVTSNLGTLQYIGSGYTTGQYIYFNATDLSPNTTYYYKAIAANSAGSSSGGTQSATTLTPPPPPTPTGLAAGSPPRFNPGGLKIVWNASSGATLYRIRIKLGVGGTYGYYTTSNTNFTFYELGYGNTYFIGVRAENNNGLSEYTTDIQFTTAPKIPTITSSSMDGLNLRVSITIGNMEDNWSFFRIWYRNVTDGGGWLYSQVSTTGSHWVTGLTSGKQYEFKVSSFYTVNGVDLESRDSSGNIGYSNSVFYTINARPNNWVWITNISQGQPVYNVIGKLIFIIPATEWNNFTNRINDFRNYKGLSNYSFTSVSYYNDFTRTILNQGLSAIRDMSDHFTGGNTLPNNLNVGDPIIVASYFTRMRDCLNSIQ